MTIAYEIVKAIGLKPGMNGGLTLEPATGLFSRELFAPLVGARGEGSMRGTSPRALFQPHRAARKPTA